MDGDRHDLERRASEHHHGIVRRYPASLRHKFRLTGMGEADAVKLFLADRGRHDPRRRSGSGDADSRFQRLKCGARAIEAGGARNDFSGLGNLQAGEGAIEHRPCFLGRRDERDRALPDATQRSRVSDREEGGQAARLSHRPALRDDFRAYPRRIAERNREGRQLRASRAGISYSR